MGYRCGIRRERQASDGRLGVADVARHGKIELWRGIQRGGHVVGLGGDLAGIVDAPQPSDKVIDGEALRWSGRIGRWRGDDGAERRLEVAGRVHGLLPVEVEEARRKLTRRRSTVHLRRGTELLELLEKSQLSQSWVPKWNENAECAEILKSRRIIHSKQQEKKGKVGAFWEEMRGKGDGR